MLSLPFIKVRGAIAWVGGCCEQVVCQLMLALLLVVQAGVLGLLAAAAAG